MTLSDWAMTGVGTTPALARRRYVLLDDPWLDEAKLDQRVAATDEDEPVRRAQKAEREFQRIALKP